MKQTVMRALGFALLSAPVWIAFILTCLAVGVAIALAVFAGCAVILGSIIAGSLLLDHNGGM